jgi:hypothetical protein
MHLIWWAWPFLELLSSGTFKQNDWNDKQIKSFFGESKPKVISSISKIGKGTYDWERSTLVLINYIIQEM